ncbi:GTP-binding protein TrmE N-terminus-domain-containing protein [Peziza echinospora]|nr:GTP-binding protein TrmE N-terminus-domain-containing protein [Peziza echinospora]
MKNVSLFLAGLIAAVTTGAAAQNGAWQQCGGIGFSGVTTCISGYTCNVVNPYYHQCLPGTAAATTTSSKSTTSLWQPTDPTPYPTVTSTSTSKSSSTKTSTAPVSTATGQLIRGVTTPVYHLYLQPSKSDSKVVVLGPEASAAQFLISGSIKNVKTGDYLNIDLTSTKSYKPLSFGSTSNFSGWGLEGDTIITTQASSLGRQLNFIACAGTGGDDSALVFVELFYANPTQNEGPPQGHRHTLARNTPQPRTKSRIAISNTHDKFPILQAISSALHNASMQDHDAGDDTTIFALSTAPGRSAIAVVRISGPACMDIYHSLCPNKPAPKPRHATLRVLYNPLNPTEPLDPGALILYFPAPYSTTGQDILELHLHGGPAIIRSVLLAIPECRSPSSSSLIQHAEPGEFTRRAFYNNRLSLPQIEALSDALTAETTQQLRLSHAAGALTRIYEAWRASLISARGELEALIDFSEDQQFEIPPSELLRNVTHLVRGLKREMEGMVGNSVRGELLRNGISIALVGPPNAGKSSLLNRVVGREAVIVSREAGTTRDVVDVSVDLGGFVMVVGDTAGLREEGWGREGEGVGGGAETSSSSPPSSSSSSSSAIGAIEREGISRAKKRVRDAHVAVVVLPLILVEKPPSSSSSSSSPTSSSQPEPATDIDIDIEIPTDLKHLIAEALRLGKEVVIAVNKIDLLPHVHISTSTSTPPPLPLPPHITRKILSAFPGVGSERIACISCASTSTSSTSNTISPLLTSLTALFEKMTSPLSSTPSTSASSSSSSSSLAATPRQRHLLQTCAEHLGRYLDLVDVGRGERDLGDGDGDVSGDVSGEGEIDVVIAAEELRGAAECLGRITGRGEGAGDVEEVLGVVFERFCVGK